MSDQFGLRTQLTQICLEAIESHWSLLEPYFQRDALEYMQNRPGWLTREAISQAMQAALDAAIRRHTETTFADVVDDIAKNAARDNLAKRLKARGMDTTLLDAVP